MSSDIKEKILSAKGICNQLLGSTLKELGCRLAYLYLGQCQLND